MKSCWEHRPEDRLRFRIIVDVLSRLHDRLTREDSEYSDTCDDSEEEDNGDDYSSATMSAHHRTTVSSNRYFNMCYIIQALNAFELKSVDAYSNYSWFCVFFIEATSLQLCVDDLFN